MRIPGGRRLYTAHAEFGRNDHWEDEPRFTLTIYGMNRYNFLGFKSRGIVPIYES